MKKSKFDIDIINNAFKTCDNFGFEGKEKMFEIMNYVNEYKKHYEIERRQFPGNLTPKRKKLIHELALADTNNAALNRYIALD